MSHHRVYCHAFVSADVIRRNVIVEWDDDNIVGVTVVPFTRETHSTTALNGIIILAPDDYVNTVSVKSGNLDIVLPEIQSAIPFSQPGKLIELAF